MNVIVATGIWRTYRVRSGRVTSTRSPASSSVVEVGSAHEHQAGVIKVANDAEGVTPEAERVLRGAARALKRTGCPISTHHWAPLGSVRARSDLPEEGAPMDRIASATARTRRTWTTWSRCSSAASTCRWIATRLEAAGLARPERDGKGAGRPGLGPPPDARARLRADAGVGGIDAHAGRRRADAVPLRDDGRRARPDRRRGGTGDGRRHDARGPEAVPQRPELEARADPIPR